MEKINIAELLRDCPKGMELECLLCNNPIELEGVVGDDAGYPIKAVGKDGFYHVFTSYGASYNHDDAKCVIFPKGKTTWEGFQRPFKDGDIVITTLGNTAIIKEPAAIEYFAHCILVGAHLHTVPVIVCVERFATEEEKEKLFQAIKNAGYKWNEKTKTLEKLVEPYTEQIKETMETITIDDFKANTKEWLIDKLESMSKDNALQAICNIHDELHKPQYPKTFEECCTVLGLTELGIIGGYRHGLLTQFRNLLICRDAYWKIADDWKFDFEEKCYYLCNEYHEIQDFNGVCDCNAVLAFPTAEMRDAFYDNFEELIKECKSLL